MLCCLIQLWRKGGSYPTARGPCHYRKSGTVQSANSTSAHNGNLLDVHSAYNSLPTKGTLHILRESLADDSLATSYASEAHPIRPNPIEGNPIKGSPTQFKPIQSSSLQSNPIQPTPLHSTPVQFNSVQSNPIQSNLINPIYSTPLQFNPIQSDSAMHYPPRVSMILRQFLSLRLSIPTSRLATR